MNKHIVQFPILVSDLSKLKVYPKYGRNLLADYQAIPQIDPSDGKQHTMAEMVKGVLAYDPYLPLIVNSSPTVKPKLLLETVAMLLPLDRISDLPSGSSFEFTPKYNGL